MDSRGTLYQHRRHNARQWLTLGAAAAAVLVMTILVAVACMSHRDREATALEPTPTQAGVADQDLPGGAQVGEGTAGIGAGTATPPAGSDAGGVPPGGGDDSEEPPVPEPPAGAVLQGYELVREEHTVEAGGFLRSSARCPEGKVVLAGGVRLVGEGSGDFGTIVQESAPGTLGGGGVSLWLAAFRNPGPAPRTAEIRAVCAEPPPGYQVVRADAPLPAGGFQRLPVACPEGTVALSGGAQVVGAGSADFQTVVQESAPGAVSGTSDVWVVALRNAGGQERTIGFKAVCAEPLSGLQIVGEQVLIPAGGFARTAAVCPAGTVVLGGGGPGVIGGSSTNYQTVVRESAPAILDDPHFQWMAAVANQGDEAFSVTVRAVCADAE